MPQGLIRVSAVVSSNEEVAQARGDPEEELQRLLEWGRILGYDVTYQPGPDAPPDLTVRAVNSTASLYRTAEGASASFADGARTAETQDWAQSYPDLADLEVSRIDRPDLADEVIWVRVSGLQGEERTALVIDDFVLLRRDRVRAFLRVVSLLGASAGREAGLERVAQMAARQVERIDAALGGEEP